MQPLEDKDGTISTDARPSDVMTARLVQQMEYYFSSDNLMRPDLYMLDIMVCVLLTTVPVRGESL